MNITESVIMIYEFVVSVLKVSTFQQQQQQKMY